uniref:Aminotransferase-like plant mobile domain-containing protein n=1 Tax=Hordeum vulgare subsp. vulgare TaxID=112509 RepID=A0A8I7B2P5_HORVV
MSWQKINLKYIAYWMDRVDVENSIVNLESQGMLELTDNQVHYVFGVPIGEHTILSEGVEPSDACVEFTRVAAGISDKGTHSLKASEEYLNRDITVDSRKIDKDCFKFAFVIFVVGHALAPCAKHDYIKIDFWSALKDVTKIKEWNWCRYLLSHLFQAVRKFKSDVLRGPPTIHIVGCHLFLQVLVLDSLDLDVNSKPQGVYPRFALFDYDSMKKMVDAISVNMGGGEISYHRSSVSPRITFSIIPNHTIFI